MPLSPVHYVSYRFEHHSTHSGYDRVADYYPACDVIRGKPISRKLLPNRVMWRLARGVISYDHSGLATELIAARHMLGHRGEIFHILYGENTYHYLGLLNNWRGNRLVATYHLPLSTIQKHISIHWHIRQLSAVICVATSQLDYFRALLGPNRVFYVPLGLDTDYFKPPEDFTQRSEALCLFVGNHMRDFPTLRGVIELVAFQRPKARFVVVTMAENFERIGNHPALELQSKVPEPELLNLYRTATLMVLPMWETTANYALLEAMGCGLPIITSQVGTIWDYVTPECTALVPVGDARAMAEKVLHLLDHPEERDAMAQQARQRALMFSWPEVVTQLQAVYEKVQ